MKTRDLLSEAQLAAAGETLPGWDISPESLRRTYEFPDFVAAFGFMAQAALCAERMNHHPDWSNVYSTVQVTLSTHDSGGVTQLDLELAQKMDELAGAAG